MKSPELEGNHKDQILAPGPAQGNSKITPWRFLMRLKAYFNLHGCRSPWKSLSEQSQNKLLSCKLLGLQQRVGLGLASAELKGDLSLWLPSSHGLSRDVPVPCWEDSGCWVLQWPGRHQARAHLHPTALAHQPKPQSALNRNHFCIFWDVNKHPSSIHLCLMLGEVKIISSHI